MAKRGFTIYVICCLLIIVIGIFLWVKEPKTILYFFDYHGADGEYYANRWQVVVMGVIMLLLGTLAAIYKYRREKRGNKLD